jgi:hypothetical protein
MTQTFQISHMTLSRYVNTQQCKGQLIKFGNLTFKALFKYIETKNVPIGYECPYIPLFCQSTDIQQDSMTDKGNSI